MKHLHLPVAVERSEGMTDLVDAQGNIIFWIAGLYPAMDEIATAINFFDKAMHELPKVIADLFEMNANRGYPKEEDAYHRAVATLRALACYGMEESDGS